MRDRSIKALLTYNNIPFDTCLYQLQVSHYRFKIERVIDAEELKV